MPTLYSFLFRSIPAEFRSDYPLEESVERIRAVVKPLHLIKEAAAGNVRQGRVWIWWSTLFGSPFKPTFIGSFHEKSGQVVLAGAFTLDFGSKAILTFGFGLIGLIAVLDVIVGAGRGYVPKPELQFLAFALGFGLDCLGQWMSRNDVTWLSAVIRRALSKNADHLQEPL
jgi:hypothetical protein